MWSAWFWQDHDSFQFSQVFDEYAGGGTQLFIRNYTRVVIENF
jgi:hypothetical protein